MHEEVHERNAVFPPLSHASNPEEEEEEFDQGDVGNISHHVYLAGTFHLEYVGTNMSIQVLLFAIDQRGVSVMST